MQQWYPQRRDETLDAVYPDLPASGRDRWLALNMVASVDGAVTVAGVSGPLGGEGDLAGFRALRAAADVVLVGAGTARAERYGPPKVPSAIRATRRARGQADRPAVAIVTRSLDLDGVDRLLDGTATVIVVTTTTSPAAPGRALAERGVEVLRTGTTSVDLAVALEALADGGLSRVLCEGGPSLNHDLLAAGLVDEVFVTVAPMLVGSGGGGPPGLVAGSLPTPIGLTLREGRTHDGELLLRYAVDRGPHG